MEREERRTRLTAVRPQILPSCHSTAHASRSGCTATHPSPLLASGFWKKGEAKVLSTQRYGMPSRAHSSATARMSVIFNVGFVGVSSLYGVEEAEEGDGCVAAWLRREEEVGREEKEETDQTMRVLGCLRNSSASAPSPLRSMYEKLIPYLHKRSTAVEGWRVRGG